MKKKTKEIFIEEALSIHGDKYDYSKVDYINARTKVCIICHKHGEFWQKPSSHISQQCGCPKCYGKTKLTTTDFIKKAKTVHSEKYNYSKTKYINTKTKVCIICPIHGEFWQTASEHLNGSGCPKCYGKTKLTTKEFIKKAKNKHNNKYDYSKVNYINSLTNVCIICKEHGEFWQKPSEHLRGCGCPKCGYEKTANSKQLSFTEIVPRLNDIHNFKYDYSKVKYKNYHQKVEIICPQHGSFWQITYDHLRGHGCPICGKQISKAENEIINYIQQICNSEIILRNRKIIHPYELDVYIPSKHIAIEYDGLIWHSVKYQPNKNYHLNKTLACEKQGIHLIHIFEDEWLNKQYIVKSKLKHILGCDADFDRIYARKCEVKSIDYHTSEAFLAKNHIQGGCKSTVYLGCYYKDNLVGVMTFKQETKGSDKWELTRFAGDITKHCIGVGGKLFKYFLTQYKPSEVKSFADRRWSTILNENLYDRLGFKLDKITKPDYKYTTNKQNLIHKFNCRKQTLHKKFGFPLSMTESEMTEQLGYYKIWDCGLYRYVWLNN